MKSEAWQWGSGAAQQFPARHFPAFSASGRIGGGFTLEGSHSNAQYNRHIRHHGPASAAGTSTSTLSPYDDLNSSSSAHMDSVGSSLLFQASSSSISPEYLTAAAQSSLAAAAAGLSSTYPSSPTVCLPATALQISGTKLGPFGSPDVQQHVQEALSQPAHMCGVPAAVTAASGAAGYVGDYSASGGMQRQQQQQVLGPQMPTTFCKEMSTPHGTWCHDGTDFSRGHLEQVLPEAWKRRPSSAKGTRAGFKSSSNSSRPSTAPAGGRPAASSRYMEPARKQWEEQQKRPLKGYLTTEVQRIMDPARKVNLSNESWYCYTPVEVLKIEREQQRAAEQQWLSEFHPTVDARYPQRSAAVYRGLLGEPGVCSYGFEVSKTEHDGAGIAIAAAAAAGCELGHEITVDTAGYLQPGFESAGGCYVEDSSFPAMSAHATAVTAVLTAAAKAAKRPAWWEADPQLARVVRQMLQPSFTETTSTLHNSSSSTSSTAASARGRGMYSTTLGVYDRLLADNAVRAADIGQQMATAQSSKGVRNTAHSTSSSTSLTAGGVIQGVLQSPEERHDVWVAELVNRSVAQRQRQVLLEYAAVTAGSVAA